MSTQNATASTLRVVEPRRLGARPGQAPANKGRKYPPQPFTTAEIFQLLLACERNGPRHSEASRMAGVRLRAAIVVMWRSGLRVAELLALDPSDLDRRDRRIVVRSGKGGKRRVVAMDEFGWAELDRWLAIRATLPHGPVFCTLIGASSDGRAWDAANVRIALHALGRRAGLTRRCNPHALRHTCAVDLWREGHDIYSISIQLGHARLDVTAEYLRSLGADDILTPIADRRPPVLPLDLQLQLAA